MWGIKQHLYANPVSLNQLGKHNCCFFLFFIVKEQQNSIFSGFLTESVPLYQIHLIIFV